MLAGGCAAEEGTAGGHSWSLGQQGLNMQHLGPREIMES